MQRLVDWFIPDAATRSRTEWELARTFTFTHLFGPLIAQPMWIYLYLVSPEIQYPLVVLALAICSFWTLPFVLRWTGSVRIAAFASFQMLSAASLFGAFHYGGFSSPFLPWLIVALLLGLFYLSKQALGVLAIFTGHLGAFFLAVIFLGFEERIAIDDLRVVGWLSICSATIYMTWMALYYSRIIGLRKELELEIERQRATARELEKARKVAEETSQARTRFFSKMSHELRTPLNAIIGYSDILLEDCDGGGARTSQRATDISRVNAAGRHLLSLVSDVLDTDKIERDVIEAAASVFALDQLADEVVAAVKPMVEQNGNQFIVTCSGGACELRTDAKKLRQILLNLLSNAGKFTHNGIVRLDFAIETSDAEELLVATVSDTGIGIAPDVLPRLFNDYEQADPTVFNRFGGTGIGLALSRKFAILLGGEISVRSRPSIGTSFTLSVPTVLRMGAADDPNDFEELPGRGLAATGT